MILNRRRQLFKYNTMRLPTRGWRYKRLSASHYVPQQQGTICCLDPYTGLCFILE